MASAYPRGGQDGRGAQRGPLQPCRSCRAPMLWVTMPSGKRNPLDLEPSDDGDVLVLERPDDWRVGVVIRDEELRAEARELGFHLHTSHFATCPDAEDHRRPRERADLA